MLIGREKEKEVLLNALNEEYSQFIAVYGRRRVGKTFLIRETFENLSIYWCSEFNSKKAVGAFPSCT